MNAIDPDGNLAFLLPAAASSVGSLAGWGSAAVAAGSILAEASISGDVPSPNDRAITAPEKPKRGVTCTCRAAANGQQSNNGTEDEYAFGTANAPTYREARVEAERIARKN